jgi:hypothetical protein
MLDLVAMRALGDQLQNRTWQEVVEGMIELSGGTAPEGVQHHSESLDDEEAARIEKWLADVTMRRKREENAEKISAAR